jgi:predicted cupin superfamily sugar epimerase
MLESAAILVRELQLEPHPEGGYFRETYRSSGTFNQSGLPPAFRGDRAFATAIYFLLEGRQFSAFHRILSDECWHFYQGTSLHIYVLPPSGTLSVIRLGNDPGKGELFQAVVPAGCWFASRPADPEGYALVGCTVSPGFDFADFEMADGASLTALFPAHEWLIRELCR